MTSRQQEINAQCDKQLKRLFSLLADKGMREVDAEVFAIVGAYMVMACVIGGMNEAERAAIRLESIIDASRTGLEERTRRK